MRGGPRPIPARMCVRMQACTRMSHAPFLHHPSRSTPSLSPTTPKKPTMLRNSVTARTRTSSLPATRASTRSCCRATVRARNSLTDSNWQSSTPRALGWSDTGRRRRPAQTALDDASALALCRGNTPQDPPPNHHQEQRQDPPHLTVCSLSLILPLLVSMVFVSFPSFQRSQRRCTKGPHAQERLRRAPAHSPDVPGPNPVISPCHVLRIVARVFWVKPSVSQPTVPNPHLTRTSPRGAGAAPPSDGAGKDRAMTETAMFCFADCNTRPCFPPVGRGMRRGGGEGLERRSAARRTWYTGQRERRRRETGCHLAIAVP